MSWPMEALAENTPDGPDRHTAGSTTQHYTVDAFFRFTARSHCDNRANVWSVNEQ